MAKRTKPWLTFNLQRGDIKQHDRSNAAQWVSIPCGLIGFNQWACVEWDANLDEAGWWQGGYAGPFGDAYVGPFRGVSHMAMIEDNPAPNGKATNLQVFDVMMEWADNNVSKPKTTACGQLNPKAKGKSKS